MAQSTMTQTKTTSATGTAVMVATAVLVATVVGTTIGITQWQQKAALVIDDLDNVNTALDSGDPDIVLRIDDAEDTALDRVEDVGDINGDGYDDLVASGRIYAGEGGSLSGFFGGATTVSTTPDWYIYSDESDFAYSLAAAGDVNGDGYDDVMTGVRSAGEDQAGAAMIYYGSATGPTTDVESPDWRVDGLAGNQYFGQAVAGLGDVNGDSYDDVAVFTGASTCLDGSGDSGIAVFHGSSTGPATTANWTYCSDFSYTEGSMNLASAGDVNGDGYADLVFGNPRNVPRVGFGSVQVFHGSATGLSRRPNFTASGNENEWYGGTVGTAGDVNGDGYDDLLVGNALFSNGQDNEGAAYVYYGSSTGLSRLGGRWLSEGRIENAYFGMTATNLGDFDGNGYDDILVAAPGFDDDGDGNEVGRVFVFSGSGSGMVMRPLGMEGPRGDGSMDEYGTWVAASEQLIGATGSDVAIVVNSYDDGTNTGPAVLIYSDEAL